MDVNLALLLLAILALGAWAVWRDPSSFTKVIEVMIEAWKNRRKK